MKRRMWSLAFGLVCAGMTLSVQGHAGWAPQKAQAVASMSALDLPGLKKPISKRFVNAKLSEVLAWLSLEKFSFVADVTEFPDQGQATLNFQQQPLGAVLDAIADVYHGRWERRGDIFTLRAGGFGRNGFGFGEAVPATSPVAVGGLGGTLAAPALPRAGGLGGRLRTTPVPLEPAPGGLGGTIQATPAPPISVSGTLTVPSLSPQAPISVTGTIAEPTLAPPALRSVRGTLTVPSLMPAIGEPVKVRTGTVRGLLPLTSARSLSPVALPERLAITTPQVLLPSTTVTPLAAVTVPPMARSLFTTRPADVTAYVTQRSQDQEEAMRQAERALKDAEAAIRKLYESGEWQKAMEKAMSEAHSGQNSDEMRKAMEEVRKAMRDIPRSAEWKQAWQKAREEMRAALKSGKVTENGKTRKMTNKEKKTLEQTLKGFDKTPEFKWDDKAWKVMPNFEGKTFVVPKIDEKVWQHMKEMPNFEGKVFAMPKMDEKAFEKLHELQKMEGKAFVMPKIDERVWQHMKEMPKGELWAAPGMDKKAWEKMSKDWPKMEGKTFLIPKMSDKNWVFTVPETGDQDRDEKIRQKIEEMHRKAGVKGENQFKFEGPSMKAFEGARPFTLNSSRMRIKELLGSLTSEQQEKQEKQGYLTLDDLTAKQLQMLGDIPKEGSWTFSYSIEGKRVTIKNK